MANLDWSSLQLDLLLLVLRRLPIPDIHRSSSVCTAWSSAVRELRRQRRPHDEHRVPDPWLMLLEVNKYDYHFRFYCVSERKLYTLPLPCYYSRYHLVMGSSHGWVVLADECNDIYFLNPITGAQIHERRRVPGWEPLEVAVDDVIADDLKGPDDFNVADAFDGTDYRIGKVLLSRSPTDVNYAILIMWYNKKNLLFARGGDVDWTIIKTNYTYLDTAYSNDKFYFITGNWHMLILDLNGNQEASLLLLGSVPYSICLHDFKNGCVVPCCSFGDLYVVWTCGRIKCRMMIWKLAGPGDIEKVVTLGNYSLFIGFGDPLCVSCIDFPQFRPNFVYINEGMSRGTIIMFSVKDKTKRTTNLNLDKKRSAWMNQVWVNPSFY